MQPTERPHFETRMQVLCAGWNVPATPERIEAYWTGLQRMPLATFIRLVEASLGEHGADKLPTVAALWALHRSSRAIRMDKPEPAQSSEGRDTLANYGQRMLLAFLLRRGGVSPRCSQALVEAKNKIIASYRQVITECDVESLEIAAALEARFEAVAVAMSADETEAIRSHYAKTGRALVMAADESKAEAA